MKLQLFVPWAVLSTLPLCACSNIDDDLSAPAVDAGVDSMQEATAPEATSQDGLVDTQQDDDPAPDAVDTDAGEPATLASLERACVALHGCLGIDGLRMCMLLAFGNQQATPEELRFGVAMQSIGIAGSPHELSPALYMPWVMDCVKAASDCESVGACVGGAQPCNPQIAQPSCQGATVRQCIVTAQGGVWVGTDCDSAGLVCLSSLTPMGSIAQCAESACTLGTPPVCNGNVARTCLLGGWVHQSCASMPNTSCALTKEMGMDMALCQGDGPNCDASFAPFCDGEDLRICQGGKRYTMRCPSGGACGIDPSSGASTCWASTLFCGAESCEGSNLRYCIDGEQRTVDCTAEGFTGCAASARGARCID
jgi:hypothetical protein